MNMLLDNDMLIFDRSMLFEGEVKYRESVEMVQEKYLSLNFKRRNLVILRIIDSKHEVFKLKKPYDERLTINLCKYYFNRKFRLSLYSISLQ